jgi:hypothetical protein
MRATLRDDEVAGTHAQCDPVPVGDQRLREWRADRCGTATLRNDDLQELTPEVLAYKSVISTCATGVQASAAVQPFETIWSQEFTPNVIPYNALSRAGAYGVHIDRALQFLATTQSRSSCLV